MGLPSYILPIMGKSAVALDPITVAWLAQLTTSFGTNPSSTFITALNTMIVGMRSDGDILLLDRFWIFAQEVQGYSRVSIVNPASTQITEVNMPTWTANQGYTGNGTTQYLNSNFAPSSGTNYTLNSCSYGMYSVSELDNVKGWGVLNGTSYMTLFPRASNLIYFDGNSNGQAFVANTTSLGMLSAGRVNSTNTSAYLNGASLGSPALATTSRPTTNAFILCVNINGVAAAFDSRTISMCFIGGAINHATFYSRFQTFATTIGFNV